MPRAALVIWFTAVAIGLLAGVLAVVFRRPGIGVLGQGVSTLAVIREPNKYIREPFSTVVRVLTLSCLGLACLGIVVAVATGVDA